MVKNIKNPVSLQNIHFGKIVLTFMLVGMMILGNVEPNMAVGELYYYDKYSVREEYVEESWQLVDSNVELAFKGTSEWYSDRWGWITDKDNGRRYWGSSYRYNPQKNEFELVGDDYEREVKVGSTYYNGGRTYIEKLVIKESVEKTVRTPSKYGPGYDSTDSGTFFYGDKYKKWTSNSQIRKIKGSLIAGDIKLPSSYPVDGIHTDGYWYVRKGLVNKSPTLTLSTPTQNSYFG